MIDWAAAVIGALNAVVVWALWRFVVGAAGMTVFQTVVVFDFGAVVMLVVMVMWRRVASAACCRRLVSNCMRRIFCGVPRSEEEE